MWGLRRRKKEDKLEKQITQVVKSELEGYVTREDVEKYLSNIQKDDTKRQLWDSLSKRKKLALLRRIGKYEK